MTRSRAVSDGPAPSSPRRARRAPNPPAKSKGKGKGKSKRTAATTTPPTPRRVVSLNVNEGVFMTIPADPRVLWRILKHCAAAEQRAHAHFGHDSMPPALMKINIDLQHYDYYNMPKSNFPFLGPLITRFPSLVQSLQVLQIFSNNYDESVALGAFAAMAPHLRELSFESCGLTSLQGFGGHCKHLQMVNLHNCEHLSSIEGLEQHMHLRVVNVGSTAITSVVSLRSCPNLTTVDFGWCKRLSSIDGLEGHQRLQKVNASATAITSIEPLHTCPNLVKVVIKHCQLSSIKALENHQRLEEVEASQSTITSIEPLRTCRALVHVGLWRCRLLPADVDLPARVNVIRYD